MLSSNVWRWWIYLFVIHFHHHCWLALSLFYLFFFLLKQSQQQKTGIENWKNNKRITCFWWWWLPKIFVVFLLLFTYLCGYFSFRFFFLLFILFSYTFRVDELRRIEQLSQNLDFSFFMCVCVWFLKVEIFFSTLTRSDYSYFFFGCQI